MGTQDRINAILILLIFCVTCLLLNCQNKNTNEQHTNQADINCNTSLEIVRNQAIELLNAIRSNNCDMLKTFFTFPINNQYIWYKVLSDSELENRNVSQPFTDKDFEKYCNKFFDIDIEKAIGTLNFDKLSVEDEKFIKSDTISVQNGTYLNKCVLSINFNDKDVILSILSNLYDENNEFLSEHIYKYYFTVLNNRLLFSSFEMID